MKLLTKPRTNLFYKNYKKINCKNILKNYLGLVLSGIGIIWEWYYLGMVLSGNGIIWDWYYLGMVLSGNGIIWEWYYLGNGYNLG